MPEPLVPLPLEFDRLLRPATDPWLDGPGSPRFGRRRRDRAGIGRRPAKPSDLLPLLGALALLCGGCVRPQHHSSGRVFPLIRHTPGDGLAVVNAPGGIHHRQAIAGGVADQGKHAAAAVVLRAHAAAAEQGEGAEERQQIAGLCRPTAYPGAVAAPSAETGRPWAVQPGVSRWPQQAIKLQGERHQWLGHSP